MHELLGLPQAPHVVFERPPVVLVLCQVRFPRVLGVADPKVVAPFQQAIHARYPVLASGSGVEIEIDLGQSDPELRSRHLPPHWQFADQDETWKVVLAQDFVALETRAYERFEDFLARMQEVLEKLVEHIRPTLVTRVGLRYVDEIRPAELSWTDVIRPELLGPLAADDLSDKITQVIQECRFEFPEGHGITLRHGLLPTGAVVQPRPGDALPTEPFYMLDIDAFRSFSQREAPPVDAEAVCRRLGDFHEAIHRLFRWCVTSQYIATLGERHADKR